MKKNIIIIDGYNVIHRVPDLERLLDRGLETAREGLFRFCSSWLATRKDVWLFYIVFDGQSDVLGDERQPAPGIRAVYTRTGEQADTRIIQIVDERKKDFIVTVVSDDNFVRNHSSDLAVKVMSSSDFFNLPTARGRGRGRNQHAGGGDDKNLTPREVKNINDSLKDAWGIE